MFRSPCDRGDRHYDHGGDNQKKRKKQGERESDSVVVLYI